MGLRQEVVRQEVYHWPGTSGDEDQNSGMHQPYSTRDVVKLAWEGYQKP